MDAARLIHSLEVFPEALRTATAGLAEDDVRWRPPDGAWSVLEIVSHLADEEQLDFKVRLRLTLEDPTKSWPPIDPESWPAARKYNEGELVEAFERFRSERGRSVEWLRSLNNPDWSRAHEHPRAGAVPAGDLLAAWTAHDWFHLRQIAKRRVQLVDAAAGTYSIDYAGGAL